MKTAAVEILGVVFACVKCETKSERPLCPACREAQVAAWNGRLEPEHIGVVQPKNVIFELA